MTKPLQYKTRTSFTKQDKTEFLRLFEENGNVTLSAKTLGFTRQTIWLHVDKDIDFRRSYFAIIDSISDEAESNLRKDIRENKKPASNIFWLKNRRKEAWGDKVEMTHKQDKKALLNYYVKLPKHLKEKIDKALPIDVKDENKK